MAGRLQGKVALITGAARGQGRSHAIRCAAEGADIIAIDVPGSYTAVRYAMADVSDLNFTVQEIERFDRRAVAVQADVRAKNDLKYSIDEAVAQLGGLDVVCANAGICIVHAWDEVTEEAWREVIGTNLTGVWNTVTASVPHLISRGGGSVICTSSTAGRKGLPFLAPYSAAKHGVVGLAKALANELACYNVRVNTVHPTGVDTPMKAGHGGLQRYLAREPNLGPIFMNGLGVEMVEAIDISNAVLFLASDESRYVTGLELYVDAGNTIR